LNHSRNVYRHGVKHGDVACAVVEAASSVEYLVRVEVASDCERVPLVIAPTLCLVITQRRFQLRVCRRRTAREADEDVV